MSDIDADELKKQYNRGLNNITERQAKVLGILIGALFGLLGIYSLYFVGVF